MTGSEKIKTTFETRHYPISRRLKDFRRPTRCTYLSWDIACELELKKCSSFPWVFSTQSYQISGEDERDVDDKQDNYNDGDDDDAKEASPPPTSAVCAQLQEKGGWTGIAALPTEIGYFDDKNGLKFKIVMKFLFYSQWHFKKFA